MPLDGISWAADSINFNSPEVSRSYKGSDPTGSIQIVKGSDPIGPIGIGGENGQYIKGLDDSRDGDVDGVDCDLSGAYQQI